MAEFKPTPSQAQAIHARGSAVLISAGAGSGKTKVLTERLMSWLQDGEQPADLDSFLIITLPTRATNICAGRAPCAAGRRSARSTASAPPSCGRTAIWRG